mmetsp:Transcript_21030/g.46158  ORF Transcript_21030/g.46158 Transcript_21030/m.46158 type:complete len:299 (-) Transcript_21030:363-1259(-)|eukprot:CAMPEP_0202903908 /NCGR_PEP_ID=MMETSP1392-20130828/27064_1 /ASSEMBLY_ACC=CAM_ASM_000868 /TAXON_ID=225041 /ORGANISM="Chlamydomonas chlamydogama, Strain SAG 11-48b" /LENGTH=298 /DNA_ID=CAMNT_0049591277 /DNA_START=159 /DNA_END=1055 /DNA_ORIENTATION=-
MAAVKPKASSIQLPGWSVEQVNKAAASLLKYVGDNKEKSNELFDDDETIYLLIALKKMPLQSRKDKPVPLPLPHPLHSPEGAEICLFVKDHQGEGHKEAKKKIMKLEKNGGITKVIGLSKLRTKYESHEAKRQLCKMYDLFLADERVLPSLPKLIGKSFFKKKKQPIPIKLTTKDFAAQVQKACACTYLYKHSGTCVNIRVGLSGFNAKQLVENIHSVVSQAVEHIPKKWSNVQGVFIKTAESVALPLYQCLPEQGSKISLDGAEEGKPAAAGKVQPKTAAAEGKAKTKTKVAKAKAS